MIPAGGGRARDGEGMVDLVNGNAFGLASEFTREFSGEVYLPGTRRYEESRAVWNADIDRRPSVVLRCATTADVVDAVELLRKRDLEFTVRGGGHNFAGLAVADDVAMIDLGGIRAVKVDPQGRIASVGGGCRWADVDAAASPHGLAVTGGVVSHTGVAGLALGGGVGYLMNRYGLTCDNLLAAEVVLADGKAVRASAESHPDLYWALRGGGGNFGIVTCFEFRLHPVASHVQHGMFFVPLERGVEALEYFREWERQVPQDWPALLVATGAPDDARVPADLRGVHGYFLATVGLDDRDRFESVVRPLRNALKPAFELVSEIAYPRLQQLVDDTNRWGVHGYEKGLFLHELTNAGIDLLHRRIPGKRSTGSYLSLDRFSGAYAEVADDATAWGGSRSARYQLTITATCPTADALAHDRRWVRELWEESRAFARSAAGYVNTMNDVEEDRVRASYGPEKYARLQQIKARYDPANVFHYNQNIQPAARELI
jgi:FAD/FMN-containing dehydrogenase